MDVHLHIEHLVVDGFAMTPAQRAAFTGAAEAELGRLMAAGGVPEAVATGFAVPALDGGFVRSQCPFHAVFFGQEVARALYASIGRRQP